MRQQKTMSPKIKLVFATNNQHKLKEIRSLLKDDFEIFSLKDIGCDDELPETSWTLAGNALQKAQYVYDKYGMDCFSDDTGLEIDLLGGRPGVYSARFAGVNASSGNNIEKVLREMHDIENRKARFKTIIALITENGQKYFEGVIEGSITTDLRGNSGFGYDPVFIPDGSEKTFAEMGEEEKNKISHRARALEKLVGFLREKSFGSHVKSNEK